MTGTRHPELERLKQRFRERARSELARIRASLDGLGDDGAADRERLRELLRIVHRMAGAAGSFGHPRLGSAAAELERDIEKVLATPAPASPSELASRWITHAEAMHAALESVHEPPRPEP